MGLVGCVGGIVRKGGVVDFDGLRRIRVVSDPTRWADATADHRQWQDTDPGYCQGRNNFMQIHGYLLLVVLVCTAQLQNALSVPTVACQASEQATVRPRIEEDNGTAR